MTLKTTDKRTKKCLNIYTHQTTIILIYIKLLYLFLAMIYMKKNQRDYETSNSRLECNEFVRLLLVVVVASVAESSD